MPDQITSHEARQRAVHVVEAVHEGCKNPPAGVFHDYLTHVMCTRCGERPEESQPKPVAAKKAVASRPTTTKE